MDKQQQTGADPVRVILRNPNSPDGQQDYWSLTVGREYEVVGIEGDDFRLLDDTGGPFLFAPACFEVIDQQEPAFWISKYGEEGERYSYPPGWGVPGFFEAWHDKNRVVRRLFAEQLAHWYPGIEMKVEDLGFPHFPPPQDE